MSSLQTPLLPKDNDQMPGMRNGGQRDDMSQGYGYGRGADELSMNTRNK